LLTLKQIASEVKGVIVGDSAIIITSVDDIEEAVAGAISFAFLPKYKKKIISSNASAFIVTSKEDLQQCPGIVVNNPYLAMIKILELFSKKLSIDHTIHANTVISKSASLGKNIGISAFSVIGENVTIGNNVTIGSGVKINSGVTIGSNSSIKDNVVIYDDVIIGKNTLIHSGSIVGSDGFGFTTIDKVHHKIPHIKSVVIGNFVELGATCTIDRGSVKNTIIEDYCKLDNQIHIAHNVKIEEGCLLAAGVCVGGSTVVGAYSMIGGKTDIGPHVILGKESVFAARSCVLKSLEGGQMYAGNPARPIKEKQKRDAVFTRLEILERRLKKDA
jgi:UDP-3-O-[3-hydroxymyristoyl] glucosamine N-acyltransferase